MIKVSEWGLLVLAGIAEIVWAVGIKYTGDWTKLAPSLVVICAYGASLVLLSLAMKQIPAGTAYTAWVGMGTFGVVLWGILFFGESVAPTRLACIGLILAGVMGLRWVS